MHATTEKGNYYLPMCKKKKLLAPVTKANVDSDMVPGCLVFYCQLEINYRHLERENLNCRI